MARIERRSWHDRTAAEVVRVALLERQALEATPAEAATWTGLPPESAQAGLFELLARHPGGVKVGERGSLRFRFDTLATSRRGADPLVVWLATHAAALEALALLVVAPAFLLTLACHAAALANAAAILPFGWLVRLVAWAVMVPALLVGLATFGQFVLAPAMVLTALATLAGGGPVAWFGEEGWGLLAVAAVFIGACGAVGTWLVLRFYVFGERNLAALGFGRLVAGTLFGPLPDVAGPLGDRRRLAALIAARQGVLTLADLMATFGWAREETEAHLAGILADYQGEAIVTEEGVLLFTFDGQFPPVGLPPAPSYERERTPPPFWDSPGWFRVGWLLACVVGLAGLLLNPALPWFPPMRFWGPDGLVAAMGSRAGPTGLGLVPYLALALPIVLRWPLWLAARRRHRRRLRFLNVLKLAVAPPFGCYTKQVPAGVAALGGTVDLERVRADGRVLLTFPEHRQAHEAAARLRAARAPEADEAIVFDTEGA